MSPEESSSKKILVVTADSENRAIIHRLLSANQDYQLEIATDGNSAMSILKQFDPDLVVLDSNLPDVNGDDLCHRIKEHTDVAVLKLNDLDLGAGALMSKSFDLMELAKQVQIVLKQNRNLQSPNRAPLTFGNLIIAPLHQEVWLGEESIGLTALEFDLLYFLASHPGQVWTRTDLIREIWDSEYRGDIRVVDVHIDQIRRFIETDLSNPTFIHTIKGVGYKFEVQRSPNDRNGEDESGNTVDGTPSS